MGIGSKNNDHVLEMVQPSTRLVDQAYHIIREAIITWKIKPGERLRQEIIARELGVSQLIIREVFARLGAEGLVSHEPYKGTLSAPNSPEDLEDLFDIRASLEGLAYELAANQLTSEKISQMRTLLPSTLFNPDDPTTLDIARKANREFHWIPIFASRRKHLIRILNQVWNAVDVYLVYNPELRNKLTRNDLLESTREDIENHTQLLEALENKDGTLARKISIKTIREASEYLQATINKKSIVS